MSDDAGSVERKERWVVVGAAVVAVALLLVGTSRYGLSLNPDSVGYKATADNLVAGNGLGWWGDPDYVVWPPLFPFVLAVGEWLTPFDAPSVALAVNVAALIVVVIESHLLLRRAVRRPGFRMVGVAAIAVAPAVLEVFRILATEPLFLAFALGAVLSLQRATEDPPPSARDAGTDGDAFPEPNRRRWWAMAVVLVWAAFLTRYMGATLVVSGAITVALLPSARTAAARWRAVGAFVIAAASVPLAWLARNQVVSGTPMGPRTGTESGLVTSTADAVEVVGQWVVWWAGPAALALGAVALAALVVVGVLARRPSVRPDGPTVGGFDPAVVPMLAFVAVYVVVLVGARSSVGFGPTLARLLAPAFVPTVVLALHGVERLVDHARPSWRRPATVGTAVALVAWGAVLVLSSARYSAVHAADGALYTSRRYEEADLAALAVAGGLDRCHVYANEPSGLFLWTGLEATLSPRQKGLFVKGQVKDLESFRQEVGERRTCLVWISFDGDDRLFTPDQLRDAVELEKVVEARGVAIYEVRPSG